MNIAEERCFNHSSREAVARCPECGRYFCRECVSEHEDRVICAFCLKRLSARPSQRRPVAWLIKGIQVLLGIVLVWLFFYFLGKVLLNIPSSFHDKAIGQGVLKK